MPWHRTDDNAYDHPKIVAVGVEAFGSAVSGWIYASKHRTNGHVPTAVMREFATPAVLRKLTTVTAGGRAPLYHRPGDTCSCLEQHDWREDMGGYWAHDYLDYNPSRQENSVHRAKARELKDKDLRAAVKARDGDRCRYCGDPVKWADRRSAKGGVLDHVDPDRAAGAANLVVACRSCNARKKNCTPEGAGMTLLPPPGQTCAGSGSDLGPDPDPDLGPDPDPAQNPGSTDTGGQDCPPQDRPISATTNDQVTGGPGRAGAGSPAPARSPTGDAGPTGHRPAIGPATDAHRTALSLNPYLRNQTASPHPDHHAGDPAPPREDQP